MDRSFDIKLPGFAKKKPRKNNNIFPKRPFTRAKGFKKSPEVRKHQRNGQALRHLKERQTPEEEL